MPIKPIHELSLDRECEFSLLPEATCSHCTGHDDSDLLADSDYEITALFTAQFAGTCTIDSEHRIRRGDRIAKVQHADNPMLPVPGVACSACVLDLPRAKQ